MKKIYFEQGPIRPPSEATSLLLRLTRNCPWNRCEFCHTYKEEKFSLRTVEEVKKDVKGFVLESWIWRGDYCPLG